MRKASVFDHPGKGQISLLEVFPGSRRLFMKRDDLLHPFVNGNKWYKLKYNIKEALNAKASGILTFGGAYSNHIYATAAAGHYCGIPTVAMVRGEIEKPLNPTLAQATTWGMKLKPLSRSEYRQRNHPAFLAQLQRKYPGHYFIPEGGTNSLAIKGCREIAAVEGQFDYWCLSCGTGGTLAGLATALPVNSEVIGFPALKGAEFLKQDIIKLLSDQKMPRCTWSLNLDYHFGGYAKITDQLLAFINDFRSKYHIPLDPIYTGKMMFGVFDLLNKGFFREKTDILAIHSGGLQGIQGIRKKYGNKVI